jgi:Fic family protein
MFSERAGYFSYNVGKDIYSKPYYTFIPRSLCRDIEFKIDSEPLSLLANAHRQLGLLEGVCRNISNMDNITRLFLIKEAVSSYSMDDELRFKYPELFGIFSDKKRSVRIAPIQNHIKALEYGISELNRYHLTNRLIYATHGILMAHKREMESIGAMRKKQTTLDDFMVTSGNMPTYNPTEPEEINACMTDLQAYLKREDGTDPLIKSALFHYQLEAIHPFESGNGKSGRISIAQYLFEANILRHTLLPISEFLLMDKVEYFDRLNAVHYWGSYEQWIKFFLKIIGDSAKTTLQSVEAAIGLREKHLAVIKSENKDGKYLLEAYSHIEKRIFLSPKSLAEALGVSYNTGTRIMGKLVDMDIMKLYRYQARNRIYFYSDFLEVVEIVVNST